MENIKKRRFGIIASIVLVLVMVLTGIWMHFAIQNNTGHKDTLSRVEKKKQITWGVKADTKLFGLMNTKKAQPAGFEIDLAKAMTAQISKQTGTKLSASFVPVSAASRIQLLKNTNIDGLISTMTITPERAKIVDFTDSYFNAGQSLLVKKNSGIQSIQDMNSSKYTVLVVVGTTAAQETKKYAPKAKIVALQDYASAMQALKAGQGQALSTDNAILYGLATENPDYHLVGGVFTKAPYGMAFDHNQKPMTREANQALATLKANGTYNRLIEKWFKSVPGLNWHELEV
ncbi:transporter substrate-binding domain-containing protein [Fructobacillus ficulneus]|uniref:Amino acid ABC transporter periplasmic protein n=1 Tax=Fructobacillus ficulneus TaxID=157463 RepID=A0A0K8MH65_9LACO|nr:transporter substrate-binding domain-containing protein [Fructobacillus ficulneus]GAO99229.1 amino acid ABC transporter periplasmic protein [Fructobacillus ficulneus]